MKPQWQLDYEAAFKAANGKSASVVDRGAGWYGIRWESGNESMHNYRQRDIVDMAARLEQRVRDEGAKA